MGIQLKIGNDIDLDDEVMEDATVAKVKIERLQSTIIKSCISSTLADNNHNNNNNNNNNSEKSTLTMSVSAYLEKVKN